MIKLTKIFFYTALFIFSNLNSSSSVNLESSFKDSAFYILKFNFPETITQIPPISAYYKGYKINFDGNSFILNQNSPINQLIIAITPQVNYKFEKNNVKYLERIENNPCKIFYITVKSDNKNYNNINNNIWSVEEENIENLPIRLPDEALVLLLDPGHISKIKSKPKKNNNNNKNNNKLINLPEIKIKKNITQEELNSSSVYSLLASLDSDAIHVPVKQSSKKDKEVVISLKLLNNF